MSNQSFDWIRSVYSYPKNAILLLRKDTSKPFLQEMEWTGSSLQEWLEQSRQRAESRRQEKRTKNKCRGFVAATKVFPLPLAINSSILLIFFLNLVNTQKKLFYFSFI
jgi:hypothetical protein